MSEEAAFLAALEANPADDTVRLVYADWLDEHNEPAKAGYLRAVVDLTTRAGGTPEYTDATGRLYSTAAQTDASWRAAAGGRFDLVVVECRLDCRVSLILAHRQLIRSGLGEAKEFVWTLPNPLLQRQPFELLLPPMLRLAMLPTHTHQIVPDAVTAVVVPTR